MKKSLIALTLFCLVSSCTKEKLLDTKTSYLENAAVYKSVTKEEYLQASALEKRFIDEIDAAVNSLEIMKKIIPNRIMRLL